MKYYRLISILVVVLILLIVFVNFIPSYNLFGPRSYKEPLENELTFTNLVLYSKDEEYEKMYQLTQTYYKKFKNVTTIYYKYNENITNEFTVKGNILDIRGKETYVPGILEKTLRAFEFVAKNQFDYLIRSNISTIVNFDLLNDYLVENPIKYGGGLKNTIYQIDKDAGIVDDKYFGVQYASGTSIIISKETLDEILRFKDSIEKNFIDDVALGILIDQDLGVVPKYVPVSRFISIPNENGDAAKIVELIKDKKYIFYRNRQPDRKTDVAQMKVIIDHLLQEKSLPS